MPAFGWVAAGAGALAAIALACAPAAAEHKPGGKPAVAGGKGAPRAPTPPAEAAAEPAAAPSAPARRINPTGKRLDMPVPLKEGGQSYGEIAVRIEPDDSVHLPKPVLIEALGKVVTAKVLEPVRNLPDSGGYVSLPEIEKAGVKLRFDASLLELVVEPNVEQRPTNDISFGGGYTGRPATVTPTAVPAILSGWLNLVGGVDHQWATGGSADRTSFRLDADSVFRLWNIVLENDIGYEGEVDAFQCPPGARCSFAHQAGVKRRGTRAVYDLPTHSIRVQAGDVLGQGASFQTSPDVLGIGIERAPAKFGASEGLRPNGRSSFRLERPSEVEVLINGASVRRLRLGPGTYNLSSLPLVGGANDVQLVVTDDTGERRTLDFTLFHEGNLLAAGKSEWSAWGGIPSYIRDNERHYRTGEWSAVGFWRHGITDSLTAEVGLQGDSLVRMGSASVFTTLPIGFVALQGAVSESPSGIGYSARASWDLNNFKGAADALGGGRESLRLSAEHRSSSYRTPGEYLATASGIDFPVQSWAWRFTAAWSVPLTRSISATLSGHYQIGDPDAFRISPYTVTADRYGIDLALSAQLTSWLNGSLNVGWSNDSYLRDFTKPGRDDPEFRVGLRFFVRPTDDTRLSASYDSLNQSVHTSGHWGQRHGRERWEATADAYKTGLDDHVVASGSVGYSGNRFEAKALHMAGVGTSGWTSGAVAPADQRTSLRAGTAIAFADGKVAIGAPVRSNGFAIVDPHETISGKAVTIGDKDNPRGHSDRLGPALVTDLPAYMPTNLPVDVADLPTGYSLGDGGFTLVPPYRAGYRLEVGSAYSVSAYGTLEKADGKPAPLLAGTVTEVGGKGRRVTIFTNATGRFGAEGLAPGRWRVEMTIDDQPVVWDLVIPKGTDGLFKAGTLKPVQR